MISSHEIRTIAIALWQAHAELQAILARDGVPYTHNGWKSGVDPEYFERVVCDTRAALLLLSTVTGEDWSTPWLPPTHL